MLLRPGLHLRARLPVPGFVRLRRGAEAMKIVARPEPSDAPPERAAASELLTLLALERPRFLAFVRKRLRSGADAEDVLQHGLLRATEHVGALRNGDRLDAWFYRVLRRAIADHHAAWARTTEQLAVLGRSMEEAPPEEIATCACSLGLLARLKPDQARLLREVDIDERRVTDVARELGVTANAATVRLHRARAALRGALAEACGTTSPRACAGCSCGEPGSA